MIPSDCPHTAKKLQNPTTMVRQGVQNWTKLLLCGAFDKAVALCHTHTLETRTVQIPAQQAITC